MPVRSAITALALAALASVALSFGLIATADEPESAEPASDIGVEWAFRPGTVEQMLRRTDAVVQAEVQEVRAGTDLILAPAALGDPPITFPTELIDLQVTDTIGGSLSDEFTLYKLGGKGQHPAGDPAYVAGETYLLFVVRRRNDSGTAPHPDGIYLTTAPDGRLEELESGRLRAEIEGPVARELEGDTIGDAQGEIAAADGAEAR